METDRGVPWRLKSEVRGCVALFEFAHTHLPELFGFRGVCLAYDYALFGITSMVSCRLIRG